MFTNQTILSVIINLILFTGFVFAENKGYDKLPYTEINFLLTLQDGVKLDCTKFIPDGTPPNGGWPCVVVTHGYGQTKYTEWDEATDLADNGYYSLVYSMRGQGESEGYSNLISRTEMYDLMQVVQYVKNDNNTNDNKIAIHGGSQGGILPFMAACNGLNVKTVLPDFASPEFATSWIENGCVKMTLLWSLSYTEDIVRYNSLVSRFKPWIYSSDRDKWDSIAYWIPRDRDFMNQVSSCQMPILISNAWQDLFFNTLGMIRSAYILPYNNYRMYFGTFDGHGADPVQNEIDFQGNLVTDWLDYWLYDIPNGVMSNPNQKFVYAMSSFPLIYHDTIEGWTWNRFNSSTWPPNGVNDVRLYLHPTGQLLPEQYNGSTTSVNLFNDVDPNLTLETAVNYEFTGQTFNTLFRKQEIIFETPQLLQDCKLAGTPRAGLFYSSDVDLCQYNFQIWDVRPNGSKKLVTRINYTDRFYTPYSVRSQYINGLSYGHIFRSGSRIRVVLTNLDNESYNWFLRTNPHALPVMKRGNNLVYVNNSSRSYLDLPLSNFVIGIRNVSLNIPENFKLYQNYPNPFNPYTKIKFAVPVTVTSQTSNIRIDVFDVLGRQVELLVNDHLKPGTYEIDFNGSKYSSGVYFYRLTVQNEKMQTPLYSQTLKMILLK